MPNLLTVLAVLLMMLTVSYESAASQPSLAVPAALRAVADDLASSDASKRAAAACEAGKAGTQAAPLVPALIGMLGDTAIVPPVLCSVSEWMKDLVQADPAMYDQRKTSPGRQAAEALGRIGQPAMQPLMSALDHAAWVVRDNAAYGLGEMRRGVNGGPIVDRLLKALRDEHAQVRTTVIWALGEHGDRRALEPLAGALRDPEWGVRKNAAWALGEIEDSRSIEPLARALKDEAPGVRETVAWALGELDDFRAVDALIAALGDPDAHVRKNVAWALGEIDDPRAVEPLGAVLRTDDSPEVRKNAAWALAEIGDRRAVDSLAGSLRDQDWRVRENAARALGEIGDSRAVAPLTGALKDESARVRKTAAWALGELKQ